MAKCYGASAVLDHADLARGRAASAELGAVELVIIDEASQSDITELPALLRGKKILVVGDDRQVSPTAPFVTQEKSLSFVTIISATCRSRALWNRARASTT